MTRHCKDEQDTSQVVDAFEYATADLKTFAADSGIQQLAGVQSGIRLIVTSYENDIGVFASSLGPRHHPWTGNIRCKLRLAMFFSARMSKTRQWPADISFRYVG